MKKQRAQRTLVLSSETIRHVTQVAEGELRQVRGGDGPEIYPTMSAVFWCETRTIENE
jgi:hypothetical protein